MSLFFVWVDLERLKSKRQLELYLYTTVSISKCPKIEEAEQRYLLSHRFGRLLMRKKERISYWKGPDDVADKMRLASGKEK